MVNRVAFSLMGGTLGIFIAIDTDKIVLAVLVIKEDFQVVIVYLECQRLLGQLTQRVEKYLGRHGKETAAFGLYQSDGGGHGRFLVRRGYRQLISFQREKKVIKNRHGVFGVDDSSHRLQMREQQGA